MMRFYPEGDNIWLFGGIFEILDNSLESYKVKKVKEYSEYEGRLKIYMENKNHNKYSPLTKWYGRMFVYEILKQPYSDNKTR